MRPPKRDAPFDACRPPFCLLRDAGFDSDADINPLALWRLHEGVSGASRAVDVAELHRLQKSSTKPRHDGEELRRGGRAGDV